MSRHILGRLLGHDLAQVFLGFRWGDIARPRRAAVSSSAHTLALKRLLTALAVRAPPRAAFFVTVIIKAPVIQIVSIVLAGFIIAFEFPAPFFKGSRFHRSIAIRIPLLLLQAFFAVLFYQVSQCYLVPGYGRPLFLCELRLCGCQGTNGAIWSLIAAGGYARAVMLGEEMKEAKENRGREGKV